MPLQWARYLQPDPTTPAVVIEARVETTTGDVAATRASNPSAQGWRLDVYGILVDAQGAEYYSEAPTFTAHFPAGCTRQNSVTDLPPGTVTVVPGESGGYYWRERIEVKPE